MSSQIELMIKLLHITYMRASFPAKPFCFTEEEDYVKQFGHGCNAFEGKWMIISILRH